MCTYVSIVATYACILVNCVINHVDHFRGLMISRNSHHSVSAIKQFKPGVWFPNINMCGGEKIWKEYADFHDAVLSGKQKGNYLIYSCKNRPCGGFGNRIEAITSALIFAMLTKRVLLIDMTYPIDFGTYVLPNAILWDADLPSGLSIKQFYLIHSKSYYRNYKEFEASLLNPSISIVEVRMNFGFFYHLVSTDINLINKVISTFKLRMHNDFIILYGCAFKYLFKYTLETHEIINAMQSKLGLYNRKYVSLHVRSNIIDGFIPNPLHLEIPWSRMFECAVLAAQALEKKLNISKVPVFLATDHVHVVNYAKEHYGGRVILSQAPAYHIDSPAYKITTKYGLKYNEQGFIGILSDIEISARASVFVQSSGSTLSELMGSIAVFYEPNHNLHPFHFYENVSLCKMI